VLGQVVDAAGTPVRGARIVAQDPDAKLQLIPTEAPPDGVAVGRSGEDGRFRIPVSPEPLVRRLFVEAEAFSPGVTDAVRGEAVRVILERSRTLVGWVRDAQEKPIAGARVKLCGLLGVVKVERESTSAADGSYRIDGVVTTEAATFAGRRTWTILVEAAGFAPLLSPASDLLKPTGSQELRFDAYLVKGVTVTGRVIDAETGLPLSGASVFLLSEEGKRDWAYDEFEGDHPWSPRLLARGRSGAGGEFRFENFPAEGPLPLSTEGVCSEGPVAGTVGALVEGHCPGRVCVPAAPDGAELTVTVKCWPSGKVTGRVVDESGRPQSGVRIWAGGGERWAAQLPRLCEGARPLAPVTDASGRYVAELVAVPRASAAEVVVTAEPRQPAFSQAKATVMLRAGESAVAPDLVLLRRVEPLIEVSVQDEAGHPVSGAMLRHPPDFPHRGGSSVTDASGRALFAMDANPVFRHDWRLLVQATGFAPRMSPPFVPQSGETVSVKVTLERGHRLSGRTTWTDGRPAPGVRVAAIEPQYEPEAVLVSLYGKQPHQARELVPYALVLSQLDGSFELRVAPRTAQRILAQTGSRPPAAVVVPAEATDVTIVVGEPPPMADERGTIEGTVMDSGSQTPLLQFEVKVQSGEKLLGGRRVGPGRFRSTDVPPGTTKVTVIAAGYPPVEREVAVDAGNTTSVSFALSSGVTLRGQVITAGEARMEGSFLVLTRPGMTDETHTRVKADASYELNGLAAGAYGVRFVEWDPLERADHEWVPENPAAFNLGTTPRQTHDFRFVKGGSLSIHMRSGRVRELLARRDNLTPAEKELLDAVTVEVRDASGRLVRSGKYLQSATFSLPFGSYDVQVSVPGSAPRTQRALVASRRLPLSFDLD
jgi:protocatechuate 3,4-dioxygenase beta subunit